MVFRNISIAICIISKLSWMEDRHQRSLLTSIDTLANQGPEFFILGLNMMADFVEQMDIPYLSTLFLLLQRLTHSGQHRTPQDRHPIHLRKPPHDLRNRSGSGRRHQCGLRQIQRLQLPQRSAPGRHESALAVSPVRFHRLQKRRKRRRDLGSADSRALGRIRLQQRAISAVIRHVLSSIALYPSYQSVQPPLTLNVLEIIMLFASIRRSIFRDPGLRLRFLEVLINGVAECLSSGHGLNDEDTYNMMCQLLGRLKVDFPRENEL